MATDYTDIDWNNIIELFKNYEGTKRSFCKLHNISIHRLYYYRKKYGLLGKKSENHQIYKNTTKEAEIPSTMELVKLEDNHITIPNNQNIIKIEIGKATLHIYNQIDEKNLSTIVKVLSKSC